MEKIFAVLAHISYLFFGIGFIIIPGIIYLYYEKTDEFVANHALEAFKVQVFFTIAGLICSALCAVAIGAFLLPIYAILAISYMIVSIYAAYKAFVGESFRYPRPW